MSRERFECRRRRLRELSQSELRAVEETSEAIGRAVADCLLETAAADSSVATALESLYPVGNETARG